MNEFKRGFGFGLWIGLILGLLFLYSPAQAQTSAQQIQQLQNEIAKRDVIIADTKAERNALILQLGEINKLAIEQNAGLEKTRLILQDAINNGGQVDWTTLINDVKWNLVLPDSSDKKPDNKDKKK